MARCKQQLVRKVLRIQQRISCTGCGLCCTERFNSVRILPVEAAVIAGHLQDLPAKRRRDLIDRMQRCVARFGLSRGNASVHYTCPFLEPDFSCALPFAVKPVACLSFNPVTEDHCDQNERDYFAVHDAIVQLNDDQVETRRRGAIPVVVLARLGVGGRTQVGRDAST
ncbi:MAG: hypothetical protein U1E76_01910 [Planctomycetota bacterium]